MLILSIVSYVAAGIIAYSLFNEDLTTGLSSYLSIICTILVGLTTANIIIEEAPITDIALITIFLIFFSKVTIRDALASRVIHEVEPYLTKLVGITTFNNLNHLASFDFLISSAIALVTLISILFPLSLDEDSWILNEKLDKETNSNASLQPNIFAAGAVVMYTQLILTTTGNIESVEVWWRILAALITVVYYSIRLIASSQHFHSD